VRELSGLRNGQEAPDVAANMAYEVVVRESGLWAVDFAIGVLGVDYADYRGGRWIVAPGLLKQWAVH